jgi:benzoyl-CoA reductase/2-hydroxyglutaryl-CoA dehydratase subunit BcrC/BadD/HgdB
MELQSWNPLGYKTLYRELFKKHFTRQDVLLKKGRTVGWFFSFHPSELIYVFNVISAFPEQYSAYCAARNSSTDLIDLSISRGYGHFICDYFKTTIGSIMEPSKATPPTMPKPDFIVDTRALCVTHHGMSDVFSKLYGVPRYTINYPYWTRDMVGYVDELTKMPEKIDEVYLEYCVKRLHGLIEFLEKIVGEKMEEDRVKKVFRTSEETSKLLIEIARLMMSKPTPGSQREIGDLVFLAFFVLGSDYAYEFARKAYDLIRDRVKKGEGVVPEERYRLITFGIMPWHSLSLYEYCERLGATFPVNLYVNTSIHLVDSKKPFESMVRRTLHFANSTYDLMDNLLENAERADLDGAVLFENTGCRITSMLIRPLADLLQEKLGIPSLIIEAPQCDPRVIPLEKAKMQIEAFLETLK